ncbi:MAG: Translation initiation factor IF-2 [candidate division CPR1 bacterium ADurb.Bin160]|uniref:Translation initiation factor IF-2 n=1 Tax=candidate division CPR1 bacterium ADurb.Bin160 TaxID=1852826 RepID=A0A1V5ZM80_9BACT|nr:MAG: Translation initiation factor IF-2 [candidate division CPR1 bacterium ADurb.Bin160]
MIVVAADDSVMPQTIESINHAKSAGVPIIIAITKIDKEGKKNIEQIKTDLSANGITPEDWG